MGFRSVWINKRQEQNNVTGKYLEKDCFGRNLMTSAHSKIAFTILKTVAINLIILRFFLRVYGRIDFIQYIQHDYLTYTTIEDIIDSLSL